MKQNTELHRQFQGTVKETTSSYYLISVLKEGG